MKVFMQCYLNKNLGDDIFAKILTERYKATFFTYSQVKYPLLKNVKVYQGKFYQVIDKILLNVSVGRLSLKKILGQKCDINILIGGSIFMEPSKSYNMRKYKNYIKNRFLKNQYILGANFGPYKTEFFLDNYRNSFNNVKDICFRDKYSYELFKDLPNVRYAPDIVFSMDTSNIKLIENKTVVISIINLENKKELKKYLNNYENKIVELIKYFSELNYKIILMSFCKSEGDEDAINRIFNIVNEDYKKNISKFFYDGDIDSAIKVLANSKIIIGSRFHANILGLKLHKTIIPIAYSNKTINKLKDINYKEKIIDIKKIDEFNVNSLSSFDLEYKTDIDNIEKESEKQFKVLDSILERRTYE